VMQMLHRNQNSEASVVERYFFLTSLCLTSAIFVTEPVGDAEFARCDRS
jgi:hypothetical protein